MSCVTSILRDCDKDDTLREKPAISNPDHKVSSTALLYCMVPIYAQLQLATAAPLTVHRAALDKTALQVFALFRFGPRLID